MVIPCKMRGSDGKITQTVKKLHSCLLAYVGATMGRPLTYRNNAFFDSPDFVFIVRRAAAVCNVE